MHYVLTKDDKLVMGGKSIVKNLQMNKVSQIVRQIGVRPVLAFGNSFSDASMLNYTLSRNPHKALGFMLLCDDTELRFAQSYELARDEHRFYVFLPETAPDTPVTVIKLELDGAPEAQTL